MKINLIQHPQKVKRTVYKVLNIFASLALIMNMSMVGVFLTPNEALADSMGTDFRQAANDRSPNALGDVYWINSILQQSNSKYYEGMSAPQRLIFTGVPTTTGNEHTLLLSHQATKGNIHAFDFITSWSQAVAAANLLAPGQNLLNNLNNCGDAISSTAKTACDSLHSPANIGNAVETTITDAMGTIGGHDIATRVAAYESIFGDRTVKLYADSSITNPSLTFTGYTGSNDKYANYELRWTSSADNIMIELAGHLSVTGDGTGVSYGAGFGSSNINGGPYHFKLDTLDGAALGSQDNQIKGADIIPLPGYIIVNKITIPSDDPTQFSIEASSSTGGTITGNAQRALTTSTPVDYEVSAGTYSITEAVPLDWSKTGDTCQGITVAAGETKYCTITNEYLEADLHIKKYARNINDDQNDSNSWKNWTPDGYVSLNPGGTVEYKVIVWNDGNTNGQATVVDSTDNPTLYNPDYSGEILYSNFTIPFQSGASMPVVTTPAGDGAYWKIVTYQKTVESTWPDETAYSINTVTLNNNQTSQAKIHVNYNCNLVIIKSVQNLTHPTGPNMPNDILEYTIEYRNVGNADCTGGGVQIYDDLDNRLSYQSGSLIATEYNGNGDGVTPLGNFNGVDPVVNANVVIPGESGIVTFEAEIIEPLECGETIIPNQAWIWSNQTQNVYSNIVNTHVDMVCYAHLTLIKEVINSNGGNAVPTNWTLEAAGPTPLSGAGGAGGNVLPGTYTLSESSGPAGYAASTWSCVKNGGSPVIGSSITLGLDDTATCTIINDDKKPSLTLDKIVDNGNGGTAAESAWTLTADGGIAGTLSGPGAAGHTDVVSGPTFEAGTYTLSESSGPAGYAPSSWVCVGDGNQSGDQITLGLNESATCTITNDDIPNKIVGHKFEDINRDGEQNGEESGLVWTFYLRSGSQTGPIEYTTASDEFGYFEFSGVAMGTYFLTEANYANWMMTTPAQGYYEIVVTPGYDNTDENEIGFVFGNAEKITLTLDKYNDQQIDQGGDGILETTETILYHIDWGVAGNSIAANVVLTDIIPVELNLNVASISNGGVWDAATRTITWDFGDQQPNAAGFVTYSATLVLPATHGDVIINVARIAADNSDPQYLEDESEVTVQTEPILIIIKTVEPSFVNPGGSAIYTVRVENIGKSTAYNVQMQDLLPAGFTFEDGSVTKTWSLGDMLAGDFIDITYTVLINENILAGTYDNLAVTWADNHGNVTDTEPVEVRIPIVLGEELPVTGGSAMTFIYLFVAGLILLFSLYVLKLTVSNKKDSK